MSEQHQNEAPAPAGRADWRGKPGAWAKQLLRPQVLGLIAAGAILFLIFQMAFPNAFHRETLGEIFVESPEIYTRERLVNDRYQQDFWLEKQLERLDASNALVSGEVTRRRSGEFGMRAGASGEAGGEGDAPPEQAAMTDNAADGPPAVGRSLPFDLDLRVRSGIRDVIRQSILENQLDDRHDLLGNSIYVLKFDATVVPGSRTRRSALIRITLDIPRSATLIGKDVNGVPSYVYAYFAPDTVAAEQIQTYGSAGEVFEGWRRGLEDRLRVSQARYAGALMSGELPDQEYRDFLSYVSRQPEVATGAQKFSERVTETLFNPNGAETLALIRSMCRESPPVEPTQAPAIGQSAYPEREKAEVQAAQTAAEAVVERSLTTPENAGEEASVGASPAPAMVRTGSVPDGAAAAGAGREDACLNGLVEGFAVREALQSVLAIRAEEVAEFYTQNQSQGVNQYVLSPGDYTRYIILKYEVGKAGSNQTLQPVPAKLEVVPMLDSVFLLSPGCATEADLQGIGLRAQLIDQIGIQGGGARPRVVIPGAAAAASEEPGSGGDAETFNLIRLESAGETTSGQAGLSYPVTAQLLATIAEAGKLYKVPFMSASSGDGGSRECTAYTTTIPSGFFNFLEALGRTDIFSYAVLPKQETQAYYQDASVAMSAYLFGQFGAGEANSEAWSKTLERVQEATSRSTVVGFGAPSSGATSGRRSGSLVGDAREEDIVFGWVITPDSEDPTPGGGRIFSEPAQRSMSAMISVPAWLSELEVKVETGWLRNNAAPEILNGYTLEVPVPSDFDSVDLVLKQGARRPSILKAEIATTTLTPCQPASILIPGYRLWRSTRVTLGSQRADRVTVLPNMEAIIASFDEIYAPQVDQASPEISSFFVPLSVWTSEGTDVATQAVRVRRGDRQLCPLQSARLDRAREEMGVPAASLDAGENGSRRAMAE